MSKLLGLAVILSGGLLSCSSSEDIDLGEAKQVVNMLSESAPIQLTQEQQVFANDNNGFTLNFLKTVNEADKSGKSFIYSPLSITYVLGMVNDAAIGQTEQELEQVLGFHQGGIQAVNDYCKKLIDGLPKVDNKVTLNIANALFVNKNRATLKAQYQQDMKQYYDAQAENLDFNSPSTLSTINGWCNDHTNGMIPNILDEIDPATVTYLLNAIYFKADWASKFDQKNTKEETFTTENGKTKLPLMHQKVLINYLKNDTYSAIEMPYGNGFWKMTVMLPEEGKTTDDIINYLAKIGLSEYSYPHEVDLKLPRFETASDTNTLDIGLIGLLQKMGINLVFDSYFAEIPNMCEKGGVYISMMRQKAKIKVNEEGSEAAAVTIAGTKYTSSIEPVEYPKATFHANRPFVYVIREASSGVILFVGKFTGA
ncbi:serpin family protein [Xylanibacter ruminicola]|nr:serpin family protein [Xylanibacter ruminicola]